MKEWKFFVSCAYTPHVRSCHWADDAIFVPYRKWRSSTEEHILCSVERDLATAIQFIWNIYPYLSRCWSKTHQVKICTHRLLFGFSVAAIEFVCAHFIHCILSTFIRFVDSGTEWKPLFQKIHKRVSLTKHYFNNWRYVIRTDSVS